MHQQIGKQVKIDRTKVNAYCFHENNDMVLVNVQCFFFSFGDDGFFFYCHVFIFLSSYVLVLVLRSFLNKNKR